MTEPTQDPNQDPNVEKPVEGAVVPPVNDATPEPADDVDETGVPYKNRAAEAQRKLDQAAEELAETQAQLANLQAQAQVRPPAPAPVPAPQQSKSDMDEMLAMGPKAYNEKIQREFQFKQNMAAAENLIKDSYGPGRLNLGVKQVREYAEANMINVLADPVRAVKKILAEIKKPKVKTKSPEEKQREIDALKNKPVSGKKTPAPPAPPATGHITENLTNRGTKDDAVAWLQDRFKKSE